MINYILSYFALRTFAVFFSTAFSLVVILLVLNIITADDLVRILNLSPEAGNALKLVLSRIQELSRNIIDVISQLLSKMFNWAGVDNVDLNKFKVDYNQQPNNLPPTDNQK